MREIKFRGKVKYNGNHKFSGDWIYGYYRNNDNGNAFITETLDEYSNYIFDETEVDESTIGQYTGLKDKNGVEIYEGDILEYMAIADGKQTDKVIFDRGTFVVDYAEDYKQPVNEINHCAKVIGNIYDNPELIEKEGK